MWPLLKLGLAVAAIAAIVTPVAAQD